jgi:hypothetical protein
MKPNRREFAEQVRELDNAYMRTAMSDETYYDLLALILRWVALAKNV